MQSISPVHSVISFFGDLQTYTFLETSNVSDYADACLAAVLDHKKEVYTLYFFCNFSSCRLHALFISLISKLYYVNLVQQHAAVHWPAILRFPNIDLMLNSYSLVEIAILW